uniref:Transmembrane protein 231 n=1 Tax=Caenorhabditis tropicalis TaxID=1561998 RepID=A0A1I7ULT1_9PELO
MPHVEIYREPVYRIYRSSECSWASFYIKLVNVFRYFLPILIIFLTDGLWKKTNTFREVPNLSVTGDFIVYAYGHDRSIIATSYPVLNAAASSEQLSTSQFLHHFDEIEQHQIPSTQRTSKNLEIQFQMSTQNLSINTLIYAFSLRMQLDYHSIVDTELFLTDTLHFTHPTSKIQTTARLSIDQSQPFQSREQFKIIDKKRQDTEHYQIKTVLKRISESLISFEMERKSTLLLSAPSPPSTLSLSLQLSISEMEFTYKTGFWELMKWFWIQYLAAFFIVDHIFSSITSYMFRNRVFYVTDVLK